MSDEGGLTDTTDALTDALEPLTESVDLEPLTESVEDFDPTGTDDWRWALGNELGAKVGREVGARIGRNVGRTAAASLEEGNSIGEALSDAWDAFLESLAGVLGNVDVDRTMEVLRGTVSDLDLERVGEGAVATATEVAGDVTSAGDEAPAGEAAEGTESSAEEVTEEGEEAAEGAEDGGEVPEIAEIPADQLRDLREDTFRQLLDVMSYDDLQSVAKELDVKANLSREEMTDRIIESFEMDDGGDRTG